MIRLADLRIDVEQYRANELRQSYPKHVDQCIRCGRGLTQGALDGAWWVNLCTSGVFVPKNVVLPPHEDQGWFPLGPGCAAHVPAAYRTRFAGTPAAPSDRGYLVDGTESQRDHGQGSIPQDRQPPAAT